MPSASRRLKSAHFCSCVIARGCASRRPRARRAAQPAAHRARRASPRRRSRARPRWRRRRGRSGACTRARAASPRRARRRRSPRPSASIAGSCAASKRDQRVERPRRSRRAAASSIRSASAGTRAFTGRHGLPRCGRRRERVEQRLHRAALQLERAGIDDQPRADRHDVLDGDEIVRLQRVAGGHEVDDRVGKADERRQLHRAVELDQVDVHAPSRRNARAPRARTWWRRGCARRAGPCRASRSRGASQRRAGSGRCRGRAAGRGPRRRARPARPCRRRRRRPRRTGRTSARRTGAGSAASRPAGSSRGSSLRDASGSSAGTMPAAANSGSVSSRLRPLDRAIVSAGVMAGFAGSACHSTYWRGVRTFGGGASPALVRNGLMSMPPRRVKRASTVSASGRQRAATSTKMRSTQCS